jgi:hypothetical protein
MARERSKLDGGVPVGAPQENTTGGNVITPVQALFNDAGAGTPTRPGPYGAIADGPQFPTASKMPGGNAKAMGSFFGADKPGGTGGKKN